MSVRRWIWWRTDSELDEEIDAHVELEIQSHVDRGLSPDEARRAALRRFGNRTRVKERAREGGPLFSVETFLADVSYGLRNLRRQPGFAFVAALSLALGIAGNTVVFSLVDSTLLKPLPLPAADRLVTIWNIPDVSKPEQRGTSSIPRYHAFRDRTRSFESVAAFNGIACGVRSLGFEQDGVPAERIYGQTISPSMFRTLGVSPLIGRAFTDDEDQADNVAPVVLISYRTWQRRFGGDAGIVGRTITLNRIPTTVIGVMPAAFTLFGENLEFFAPLCITRAQVQSRVGGNTILARLKLGVSITQAQAELDALAGQLAESEPELHRGIGVQVESLQRAQARLFSASGQPFDYGTPLLVLQGAVAFVLLIACANVAGLLLARTARRRHEIALRLALGAGRWRVVRQLVTESLPLAALGGIIGVALSWAALGLFLAAAPADFPRRDAIAIDLRVLGFTAVVVVMTSVLFALIPAVQAARSGLANPLHDSGRGSTSGPGRLRMRRLLAAGQTALALVLLIGAGLMIRSFVQVTRQNLGADPANVLTFELRFPLNEVAKQTGRYRGQSLWDVTSVPAQTFERVLERLQHLSGVSAAGGASTAPLSGVNYPMGFAIDGRPAPPAARGAGAPQDLPTANYMAVTRGFFSALRIPLLQGRDFDEHDTGDRPFVMIINQTMARQFFAGEDPLGQRITLDFLPDEQPREIVGVVGDTLPGPLDSRREPVVYVPHTQQTAHFVSASVYTRTWMNFVVRTAGDPMRIVPAVKRAVADVDRSTPIAGLQTVEQSLDDQVRHMRLYMYLLGAFGAVAVLLAATGIYGLMAYSVAERTREIGIRMALGARAWDVLSMVLRQTTWVVGIGTAAGLAAALMLTRLIRSVLIEVGPTDPAAYVVGSIAVIAVGALAALVPSRRAVSVDPTVALKDE
jgi:predicted permease